jgi:putative zinc finger/helix-turn-helix YgiT family protein
MKTKKKRPPVPEGIPCFECEGGTLLPMLRDHRTEHPKLGVVTVPDVPMLSCESCGSTVIGDEGNRRIDAFLDKALNAISPAEIQAFLDKYGLTQKRASEITGLGEKNISRWLGGRSRPSESVSNFLRILLAEESAFERLTRMNSPAVTPHTTPAGGKQAAEEEKAILKCVDYPALEKIGVVAPTRSPAARQAEMCRLLGVPNLKAFRDKASEMQLAMAAFKDTNQHSNPVSGAIWIDLGCQVARTIDVKPYDREKLVAAARRLRGLTNRPLAGVIPEVQQILADAGVALVFMPLMKHSAFRGCTRLLDPGKAVIIHSLKYRNLSQFWLILFHEIAHLVLHIHDVGDVFAEYDDQAADPRETEADEWARDTLVHRDVLMTFRAHHGKPDVTQLRKFADELGVHPAIAAEVFNRRAESEVINYALLRAKGLFPNLSEKDAEKLWQESGKAITV